MHACVLLTVQSDEDLSGVSDENSSGAANRAASLELVTQF